MINWTPPKGTKVVYPSKGLNDKDFNFTRGSNVQEIWREYGWTPPSDGRPPPPPERPIEMLKRVR